MNAVAAPPPHQAKRVHRAVLLDSAEAIGLASDSMSETRRRPNILITGTPGTGKTTHAELVASEIGLRHINVGDAVKEHELHDGYSDEFKAYWINEDKVNDYLEGIMAEGGVVVDHHSCGFFPERFFDLVVVLRTDNTLLYDRLAARGYGSNKIQENVQCEIFMTVQQEAEASYKKEVLEIRTSNELDDMESNVEAIVSWCRQYSACHGDAS